MKERRMVQVLHKFSDAVIAEIRAAKDLFGYEEIRARLAVGKTFRFTSGDRYTVTASGAVVNADPKSYIGKAGRKRMLRERRADRELARANIQHLTSDIQHPIAKLELQTAKGAA